MNNIKAYAVIIFIIALIILVAIVTLIHDPISFLSLVAMGPGLWFFTRKS